jgi:hypothetical protein
MVLNASTRYRRRRPQTLHLAESWRVEISQVRLNSSSWMEKLNTYHVG